MDNETPSHRPQSVIERARELEQERIKNREVIHTPIADFSFPFLRDSRFLNSPNRDAISKLDLQTLTVDGVIDAMRDLRIKPKITVTTLIPEEDEENYIIPSLGIGGRAFSAKEVRLYFDSHHPKTLDSLRIWKKRQIAHELNHVARFQANKVGHTLLNGIITEGLATYYEEHWENEYLPTPWGNALTQDQIAAKWQEAKSELDKQDFDYGAWFFGKNGKHPVWTGYSLGTAIVNEYFRTHPDEKMVTLVRKPAKDILKASGFNPRV